MDQKTKQLLEEKAKHLAPEWLKTGIKRPNENFFGLLTKKQMSLILWLILVLVLIADLAIFTILLQQ